MIQMGDSIAVERCLQNLNNVTIGTDGRLQLGFSKQAFLSDVTNPYILPDKTASFKDFTGSKNNRWGLAARVNSPRFILPSFFARLSSALTLKIICLRLIFLPFFVAIFSRPYIYIWGEEITYKFPSRKCTFEFSRRLFLSSPFNRARAFYLQTRVTNSCRDSWNVYLRLVIRSYDGKINFVASTGNW